MTTLLWVGPAWPCSTRGNDHDDCACERDLTDFRRAEGQICGGKERDVHFGKEGRNLRTSNCSKKHVAREWAVSHFGYIVWAYRYVLSLVHA